MPPDYSTKDWYKIHKRTEVAGFYQYWNRGKALPGLTFIFKRSFYAVRFPTKEDLKKLKRQDPEFIQILEKEGYPQKVIQDLIKAIQENY